MEEAIFAELVRAAAGSRELDRLCERHAQRLLDNGTEPDFAISSADFVGDGALICADRYWRLRFLDHPTISTAGLCAEWIERNVATKFRPTITEKWALGYAFITRDTVESETEVESATHEVVKARTPEIAHFAALYHAGKFRANFNCDELGEFLTSSPLVAAGKLRTDPLFLALESFAAFGRHSITSEHAVQLLEEAWQSPDRTRAVIDICLNGLWWSRPFDRQGELVHTYAREAIDKYPKDNIFYYRLAAGQRMCENYDEALRSIDTALELLPATGNRGSHQQLQEQYLTERNSVRLEAQRTRWMAEQKALIADLKADNTALRETVQSAPVRMVEVVAVFTAAIAFAVGSLQVTLNGTLPKGDRVVLIATLGAGLLLFALLIIGSTWFITRVRRRK
ncbi:hypothetical protein [Amycolatopsis sp. CA-230715]|uniref:hypothetical protein n=1 Tax=Amycolatopsis sp. CA-230715 TaxID=2745196 RepID=UPI001C00C574|nr:hypothetical protein [Amycolatopsis sp. CA-230715]QWF82495.1 hypothetical protein HUW46_05932 [Amycolatopsis sp. CA-230715]